MLVSRFKGQERYPPNPVPRHLQTFACGFWFVPAEAIPWPAAGWDREVEIIKTKKGAHFSRLSGLTSAIHMAHWLEVLNMLRQCVLLQFENVIEYHRSIRSMRCCSTIHVESFIGHHRNIRSIRCCFNYSLQIRFMIVDLTCWMCSKQAEPSSWPS